MYDPQTNLVKQESPLVCHITLCVPWRPFNFRVIDFFQNIHLLQWFEYNLYLQVLKYLHTYSLDLPFVVRYFNKPAFSNTARRASSQL